MKLCNLNIALKIVGFTWCFIALTITWVSDWFLIAGKTEIYGLPVFDVKNSYSLAFLLFPGALFLIIPYILEKWFSIGLTKNAAIKQYYTNLPKLLSARYGKSSHYSYGQVKSTIVEYKLSQDYMIYAFAMCLNMDEYEKSVLIREGFKPGYMELREELANDYFGSKQNFDVNSLTDTSFLNHNGTGVNSYSDGSGDSGSGDSGGGDG